MRIKRHYVRRALAPKLKAPWRAELLLLKLSAAEKLKKLQ